MGQTDYPSQYLHETLRFGIGAATFLGACVIFGFTTNALIDKLVQPTQNQTQKKSDSESARQEKILNDIKRALDSSISDEGKTRIVISLTRQLPKFSMHACECEEYRALSEPEKGD